MPSTGIVQTFVQTASEGCSPVPGAVACVCPTPCFPFTVSRAANISNCSSDLGAEGLSENEGCFTSFALTLAFHMWKSPLEPVRAQELGWQCGASSPSPSEDVLREGSFFPLAGGQEVP